MTLHRDLLEELERNLTLLRELARLSRAEFLGNPRNYLLAERCFQLAIQCILDFGFSLAARQGWPKPEDGKAAILALGEHEVIPGDFAQSILGMANFRNILVHAYLGINRELVFEYLSRLSDFEQFLREAEAYLARS